MDRRIHRHLRPDPHHPRHGAYITAAYWFTSSTSFANPAITVARSLTDTFVGIAPHDVLPFIAAQLLGAGFGALAAGWLFDRSYCLQSVGSRL
jgi:glycerol uptake facilitator-like aquaporin